MRLTARADAVDIAIKLASETGIRGLWYLLLGLLGSRLLLGDLGRIAERPPQSVVAAPGTRRLDAAGALRLAAYQPEGGEADHGR
jgi:hypothetical protein